MEMTMSLSLFQGLNGCWSCAEIKAVGPTSDGGNYKCIVIVIRNCG